MSDFDARRHGPLGVPDDEALERHPHHGRYDEARQAALKKAQTRAEMYAKSLGLQVRRIVSISEGGGFRPPGPMPMMAMARGKAEADTAISPGETALSANLDVVFELGN